MSEMVERVAERICEALSFYLPEPLHWLAYQDAARAAFAALREMPDDLAIITGDAINSAPQTAVEAAREVIGTFVDVALQ